MFWEEIPNKQTRNFTPWFTDVLTAMNQGVILSH